MTGAQKMLNEEHEAKVKMIFGDEMAKIFVETLDHDQIVNTAKRIWNELCCEKLTWREKDNMVQADSIIRHAMAKVLREEVENIISSEVFREQMKTIAKNMVDDIVKETYRKTVDEISNRMTALSTGCGGLGLQTMIEQTVLGMMNR